MVRVLYVLSSLNISSGIANYSMNYYRNFDKSKIVIDFLCFAKYEKNFEAEVKSYGGEVYYFTKPGLKNYGKAKKDLESFFANNNGYDILHCHEILVGNIIVKYAKKYGIKNIIMHSHNSKLSTSTIKTIRNRLLIIGLKGKSDFCFACSPLAGEVCFGKNITKDKKYKTIYNAIEIDKFLFNENNRDKIRKKFNIEDKFVLGHTGRLSAQKNQVFLLSIMSKLKIPNAHLLLVGGGEDETMLKNKVKELSLEDKVTFAGHQENINEYYSAFDVFVFPSIFEGLGISAIEAQANGGDVILSDQLPKEAFVLDNVIKLPLIEEEWIKNIESCVNDKKRYNVDKLKKDYSIINEAEKLQNTYVEMSKLHKNEI